jgi:hypothetical protein
MVLRLLSLAALGLGRSGRAPPVGAGVTNVCAGAAAGCADAGAGVDAGAGSSGPKSRRAERRGGGMCEVEEEEEDEAEDGGARGCCRCARASGFLQIYLYL